MLEDEATPGQLHVPIVDRPPATARLGDIVYRLDFEEYAVSTVLGWVACRPAKVPAATG
jgi:hypothetical protein